MACTRHRFLSFGVACRLFLLVGNGIVVNDAGVKASLSTGRNEQRGDEIDVLSLILLLWQHRAFIVALTAICALAAIAISFLLPPIYKAEVTILPQNQSDSSQLLSRVAAFAGLSLDGNISYEQLYGKILKSDRILDALIARKWQHRKFAEPVTLYEIFGIEPGADNLEGQQRAEYDLKKILQKRIITFTREDVTGFMVLGVHMPHDPELAAVFANALAEELDKYNRTFRNGKAVEQRLFIEERMAAVELDLREAENVLAAFLETNRSYSSSPSLLQRYGELSREVEAQSSMWVELRRQLELAKLEENKGIRYVDILDKAIAPIKRSSPRRALIGLVGIVSGVVLSLLVLYVRKQVRVHSRSRAEC